ncbi:MAG TPA: hypothetical protein VKI45_08675, partial [Allosphingosinicella sp.]|nr:hypothetical protein [Allosphingosinicella sp.]
MRWTLHLPRSGPGSCALWACAFDRSRPQWFAARATHPADAWRPIGTGVEIDGSALSGDGCHGTIDDADGRHMEWQLGWEPHAEAVSYFPGVLERMAASATFPIAVIPMGQMHGTVSIDGETLTADGAAVEQTHLFGGRHAARWRWLHALGFEGDKDGYLTLIWARPQRLGGAVPAASSLALRVDGRTLRSGGAAAFRSVRWRDTGPETAQFHARLEGTEVEGEVSARRDWITGVTYHDPDGSRVYCAN